MDFFDTVITIAIAAVVIYGMHTIYVKFMVGDMDNAFEGNPSFNPRMSLNKTLNQKMIYYQRISLISMRWLIFYMNFILPILTIVSIRGLIYPTMAEDFIPDISFYTYLAFTVFNLMNMVLFRMIDSLSFYLNFMPGIALLIHVFASAEWLIVLTLVVYVPAIGFNAWYFIRRRELFTLDLRQMKQKAEEIDAQNAS